MSHNTIFKVCWRRRKGYFFEPQKDIYMILCTNLVLNICNNVIGPENKSVEIKRSICGNTGGQSLIVLTEGNNLFLEAKIMRADISEN